MSDQNDPGSFADFDLIPAKLSCEQLQAIDQKVIAFVRALSSGDEMRSADIERCAMTDEPLEAFGTDGAMYLRQAIEDAKVCFELLRPIASTRT